MIVDVAVVAQDSLAVVIVSDNMRVFNCGSIVILPQGSAHHQLTCLQQRVRKLPNLKRSATCLRATTMLEQFQWASVWYLGDSCVRCIILLAGQQGMFAGCCAARGLAAASILIL